MRNNNNPAMGADLQPFSGITTFMRLPAARDLNGVDAAILGVPYDGGTSYRSGARFGPRKIREASSSLWGYNQVLRVEPVEQLALVDYGDVPIVPVDIRASMDAIEACALEIIEQDVNLISLGGDHSIVLPLLRAYSKHFGPVAVIHFDSHTDTLRDEFPNFPYSHGTPFRHAITEGCMDLDAYFQIGIRGPTSFADDWENAREMGARVITIHQAMLMGTDHIIQDIHATVKDKLVYISLDIDAVDPAFAPGTGTPEVGGFTSYEILQLVRGLDGLNLVGFDLVEVCPAYDHSDITSILAANLVFEFLSLLARKKKNGGC